MNYLLLYPIILGLIIIITLIILNTRQLIHEFKIHKGTFTNVSKFVLTQSVLYYGLIFLIKLFIQYV